MRLFVAVNFSDEVKNRILEVREQLRGQTLRGNFTRPENLHLTLAFIGETPEEKLDSLYGIIEGINAPPFEMSINCSGCFSRSGKELWWIGTDPKSPCHAFLENINRQLFDHLLAAGFLAGSASDSRRFSAHITIGREIKRSRPVVLDFPEIKAKVDRISLMKSEHVKGKLTYTEIFGKELSSEMT